MVIKEHPCLNPPRANTTYTTRRCNRRAILTAAIRAISASPGGHFKLRPMRRSLLNAKAPPPSFDTHADGSHSDLAYLASRRVESASIRANLCGGRRRSRLNGRNNGRHVLAFQFLDPCASEPRGCAIGKSRKMVLNRRKGTARLCTAPMISGAGTRISWLGNRRARRRDVGSGIGGRCRALAEPELIDQGGGHRGEPARFWWRGTRRHVRG